MINSPFLSRSPEETLAFAGRFTDHLRPGAVFALYGDLGSGKTCFVRGLARALHITAPVTSPTFTLVSEYRGPLPLYHMDLYRLKGPDDLDTLGLDDYIDGDGITVIEWAERAEPLLPASTLRFHFAVQPHPGMRLITLNPQGAPEA